MHVVGEPPGTIRDDPRAGRLSAHGERLGEPVGMVDIHQDQRRPYPIEHGIERLAASLVVDYGYLLEMQQQAEERGRQRVGGNHQCRAGWHARGTPQEAWSCVRVDRRLGVTAAHLLYSGAEHLIVVETMTDEQRQHLEQRLLEERARVVEALDRYRAQSRDTVQEQTGNISNIPFHLADEGTDTMDEELDASEAARETAALAEIDDALRRLYQSPESFGRDERTGREIPFERLDVIPWARTIAHEGRR
jgi:DnaK suppressor protein